MQGKLFKISTFKLNFWKVKLSQGKYKNFHKSIKNLWGYNTKAPILIESQKGFQLNSRWQTKKMHACNICLKTSWKIQKHLGQWTSKVGTKKY